MAIDEAEDIAKEPALELIDIMSRYSQQLKLLRAKRQELAEINNQIEEIVVALNDLSDNVYNNGVKAGIKQGLKAGKLSGKLEGEMTGKIIGSNKVREEIAISLLAKDISVEIVAECTGLQLEKAISLKKSLLADV